MSRLDRLFKLSENGTTAGTEVRAGVVTFLTMSYIIFVQPIILAGTGLSWHTVFMATCISAAVGTLLMAFFANYPIALAAAMGHNVLFVKLCRDGTINWRTGLGAVCISGTLFIALSLFGFREKIVNAIPPSLKHAIAVGIGILIAFLGFQWAGLAVDSPFTLVQMGDIHMTPVLLALGGLLLTAALIALKLRGAILIGILVTALVGIPLGITSTDDIEEKGVVAVPESQPMPWLVILPAHVPEGIEADVSAAEETLERAAIRYYDRDDPPASRGMIICRFRFAGSRYTREVLAVAKATIPPDASPGRICDLARKYLGPAPADRPRQLLVFPKVEQAAGRPVLRVVAYDVDRGKVWRDYGTISLAAESDVMSSYAKDIVLGLPGHTGLLRLDILGAIKLGVLHVIFIFFFLDLFDTIGTLIGVSQQAGFLKDGKLPRARGALLADAVATVVGAGLGTSTVTSYVESSAGVADGARTGLANVVTALLFIAALFFAPVVKMVGGDYQHLHPAVAPVLIIIGSIMLRNVVHITWTDPTEALPAFLAIMVMPLTFSITEGIAFGFISYSFLKLVTGRGREVHWLVYLFSILFIVRYAYVGT